MSSPMITSMLGFCCCADAGANIAVASSASRPSEMFLLMLIVDFMATVGSMCSVRRSEAELWREFGIERPRILGALLDALVHGLRAFGSVHLNQLPRMADFALWTWPGEPPLWPAGTFARAYAANRRAAIESIIEADPIATCLRTIMADRTMWMGKRIRPYASVRA